MHVRALGASACIGNPGYTTCLLAGQDTLVDCGTGAGTLSTEDILALRSVLLTHSHLDHTGLLPLLADVHACHDGPGLDVYGLPETLDALSRHFFNDAIWPDYARQENGKSWLRMRPIDVGDTVPLTNGLATALPAQHTQPALGWLIEGPWRALAYSGDSAPCPAFWQWVCGVPSLTDVICEVCYNDALQALAGKQGHSTPGQLASYLAKLPSQAQFWVTHIDSRCRTEVIQEMQRLCPANLRLSMLKEGTLIEL
ncbi:3',5'-cyclic-nucleotide phosphodiesterase [Chromobacterium sp. IIBBL 290-4]|uniref:3',5'-cyclic-nucleotide phosphodiesterase n=1 Tax=Chromobacterium sp. IIBBL 290-4 TaxID=2953890 RepID=UPI0020B6D1BE|nr:3',5'-cyclic-nucleotide phosphodiesterase [Chromobacterium sp. IIBBL 290-4]UTH74822.1 3',5'-cyclic-nucleotide phosphodiesterase [Chromobacterium sp. IIBBL 290-4]